MEHSKLTDHHFKKGKFITPFNQVLSELLQEDSWHYGRMPEYIWLGLIINADERTIQMGKCLKILMRLNEIDEDKTVNLPKFSLILKLDDYKQVIFFTFLKELNLIECLKPLSVVLSGKSDIFDYFVNGSSDSISNRVNSLNKILDDLTNHQSELSTDVRYLIIHNLSILGTLHISSASGFPANFFSYPFIPHEDEEMTILRPSVRSMEIALGAILKGEGAIDFEFVEDFWRKISLLTDCEGVYLLMDSEGSVDLKKYKQHVYDILTFYKELFTDTRPLDDKLFTLLGIVTYSYKRLSELIDHELENTITGRTIVRSLIENYMMTKYLLLEESKHENIWKEFQYYGIGQYKLIYERYAEYKPTIESTHVDFTYMDLLVSEYTNKEFLDMDTRYFGSGNIKNKFDAVGESNLWKYCYDYDSQFEHGLWGAIRESSILKCTSPGHLFHGIPDVDNQQKMRSVAMDCVMVMNNHLGILKEILGLPEFLGKEDYYE